LEQLNENRLAVLRRIERSCADAGRDPSDVRLVAVTKEVDVETALELSRLGQEDLGESRADELERKAMRLAAAGAAVRWHFLGRLQRNKARRVVRLAHAIHSVDSLRLIDALARLAAEEGRCPRLFLQAKLADEAAKGGFAPAELADAVGWTRRAGLPLEGLMAMAPLDDPDGSAARAVFAALARLSRELPGDAFLAGAPRLSMGMSRDFEDAIRAGSHVVRVGSALFERRVREGARR